MMNSLIETGFVLQTKGRYPVLHPTLEGDKYFKEVNKKDVIKVYKKYLELVKEYKDNKDNKNTDHNKKQKHISVLDEETVNKVAKAIREDSTEDTKNIKKSILKSLSSFVKKITK